MDIHDIHPPDDYSHRFFIWHEWIQANGPLTTENAFEYFTTSMFYDKQSNNQVLRMQTMHTGMPIANEAEELKRFTGVEFAVVHAEPPSLFVIHKRERLSPEEVRPLAAYFIVNNRIYQSPDLYTVLSNRLLTSLYSLQSSLDCLRNYRPDFTPRTGFVWPIVDPALSQDTSKKRNPEEEVGNADEQTPDAAAAQKRRTSVPPAAAASSKKQQNSMLLMNAMRTTAAHSNTVLTNAAAAREEASGVDAGAALGPASRSSVTPIPGPSHAPTPKPPVNTPTPQETSTRGPPGAGKKKRKRTSLAVPLAS